MTDAEKPYLTLEEVAERLGVHYQLIYRLVRSGELPAIRLGRVYRVEAADLQAYLVRMKTAAPEGHPDLTCAVCGKNYRSRESLPQSCPECGRPICLDCWTRRGVRKCPAHV